MHVRSCWSLLLVIVLGVWLSGCQTTGTGSSAGRSPGVESLTQPQADRYQQALNRLEKQEAKGAEKLLQDLLRERGDVAEIWLNLALSQYQQSKWQDAETTVQKTLASFPNVAQAHNLAGLLAVEKGEFQAAEQHYKQAFAIDPSYANALYNMALLQDIYLRNIKLAVDFYNRYLQYAEGDDTTQAWVDNLKQSLAR